MRRTVSILVVTVALLGSHPSRAGAVTPELINKAVERGVAALKNLQNGGVWPHNEVGCSALAALTLLECEVSPEDKVLTEAASYIRMQAPRLISTYSVSLVILFLDRLGDPADIPLIESLSLRLIAGQGKDGGWAYECPLVGGEAEASRLAYIVKNRVNVIPFRRTRDPKEKKRTLDEVSPEIKVLLKKLSQLDVFISPLTQSDNSNTQFATLALWVARRYGIPVHKTLLKVGARFRASQKPDGGWGYHANEGGFRDSLPTMTCAGVLALAVGRGAWAEMGKDNKGDLKEEIKVAKDVPLQRGLKAIASCIDQPASVRRALASKAEGKAFYFLWSLERVAMALGAEKFDKKDWYTWGAEILLVSQKEDGSWKGDYAAGGPDTCFALLFLKRSNLAMDLTHTLRGEIKDMVVLRGEAVADGDKLFEGVSIKRALEASAIDRAGISKGEELARSLIEVAAGKRDKLLEEYRDGKGTIYTEALAAAIPQLDNADRKKARDYLSTRLTRMKSTILSDYLHDDDAEIRRAAAWACARKDSKAHIPDLINLLNDADAGVAQTAHEALRELTAQSIPFDAKERAKAIKDWKDWWAKQRK